MSSIFLTKNQRELIKFQKDYALGLKNRKTPYHSHQRRSIFASTTKKQRSGSDFTSHDHHTSVHSQPAANEALLDFNPDKNEIDRRLYDNIVDDHEKSLGQSGSDKRYNSSVNNSLEGEDFSDEKVRDRRQAVFV